jgi:hypothetical protein
LLHGLIILVASLIFRKTSICQVFVNNESLCSQAKLAIKYYYGYIMRGPDQRAGVMRFTHPDSGIKVVAGPGHVDTRGGIKAGPTRLIPVEKPTPVRQVEAGVTGSGGSFKPADLTPGVSTIDWDPQG